MRRSITLVAVFVFCFSVMAQEEPPVAVVAEPRDPAPGSETAQRELSVVRSGRVTANAVIDGSRGDLVLDGSDANYSTTGVLLRSPSGYPNISARLGGTTSASKFGVFSSGHTSLFAVDGAGLVGIGTSAPATDLHLFRGDAFSTVRVEHTAAGTSGAARGGRVQFYENGTVKATIASIGSGSTGAEGGANALQLWNFANGPLLMATNSTERMRITANGLVGIGLINPAYRLHVAGQQYVFSSTANATSLGAVSQTLIETNAAQSEIAAHFNGIQSIAAGASNAGALTAVRAGAFLYGAGTLDEALGLYVRSGVYVGHTGTVTRAVGMRLAVIDGAGSVGTGIGLQIPDVEASTGYGVLQEGVNDTNVLHGKTRIGANSARTETLVVTGDAYVTGTVSGGNIKAHYQDLAEWVPSEADLAPGTVVVLHRARPNEVISSAKAYDTSVAGVVSAQPGIILGEEGVGKEQIATTGRVKVRVDARKAPVRIGDLLVTSDVPGTAMRSESIEIGGHHFHRPGTIIGKALEHLDGGVGEILVLLSLQ